VASELPSLTSSGVRGHHPRDLLSTSLPDDLPAGAGVGAENEEAGLAGDRNLRRLVQERIDFVARLVGPLSVRRAGRSGLATVRLRVDGNGYVASDALVRSTGSPRLDAEIHTVLHLAEPYPPFRGWLEVFVLFEGTR